MTDTTIQPAPKLKVSMIGLIGSFAAIFLVAIFEVIGVPIGIVPLVLIGLIVWALIKPEQILFGWPLRRVRNAFIAIFVVSLLTVSGNAGAKRQEALESEAKKIIAMGQTNSSRQKAALATADSELLDVIGKTHPEIKKEELARRELADKAEKAARNAAITAANKEKVATLLKQADAAAKGNYDDQN